MPNFRYRALDRSKRSTTGVLWALDRAHALRQLESRGFQRIFLKSPARWRAWLERYKPFSSREQALCCKQLATLMKAGVPIVASLDTLLQQPLHPGLYRAYQICLEEVQKGSSLSLAMSRSRSAFGDFYVGLVAVGERTGALVQNLDEVARHLERELDLQARVRAAFTYPVVVSLFSLSLAYLMVQHILPRFINGLFSQSQQSLPWMTRALIGFTAFFQKPEAAVVVGGLVLGGGWFLFKYAGSAEGRAQFSNWAMGWKPTRDLVGKFLAIRTARMLASGVEAGLTVSDSLQLAAEACGNPYLRTYLQVAGEDLKDGSPLSRCLRAIPFVPPLMCGFVELGEEAAGMPMVLRKSADILELDVEQTMHTATQMLEPLLVGAMGLLVGFVLIALFIPIYQMLGAT